MKKLYLFLAFIALSAVFSSCLKDEEGDKEKIVKMTIYPETGYSGYFMSDNVWGEFLMISDSDDKEQRLLANSIIEGFNDFNYEEGYKYSIKVRKIWMKEPPQDVSSIKYIFLETLSREKVINADSESIVKLVVASKKVQFIPRTPTEDGKTYETPQIYDALLIKEEGKTSWRPLIDIEGFNYKQDYEYTLSVKKILRAEPYSVRYILLDVLSQKEKTDGSK
jgi:hypothetical protein